METETRLYEIGYFLKGDLGDEEALKTGENIRKTIEDEKGLVLKENQPRKQNLAYSVKKQNTAYFGSFQFIFPLEKTPALKKSLERLGILRLLLTQMKQQRETAKIFPKRRLMRRPPQKEFPISEGKQEKEPLLSEPQRNEPARNASRSDTGGTLQVEEIDKKLEEILNQ